ncbi:hypothetical protein BD410DRAFT_167305 [Rickenella mellea]|uniref:Uncharacterized protein n=1 Tax=Rickenella mellea TaxID=50990 RepID=A0A4Y7PHN5_9AGAM|nr:hypothetical protein BD410DRAFT_167305 [Rickenella mellea]
MCWGVGLSEAFRTKGPKVGDSVNFRRAGKGHTANSEIRQRNVWKFTHATPPTETLIDRSRLHPTITIHTTVTIILSTRTQRSYTEYYGSCGRNVQDKEFPVQIPCRFTSERNQFQIQNCALEKYSASCEAPMVQDEANVCAREMGAEWIINEEGYGKPLEDRSLTTYTISSTNGAYWLFKTDASNAEVVVRRQEPNSSNWWIFEPVEPSYHFSLNVACKYVPSQKVEGTGGMTLDPRQYMKENF